MRIAQALAKGVSSVNVRALVELRRCRSVDPCATFAEERSNARRAQRSPSRRRRRRPGQPGARAARQEPARRRRRHRARRRHRLAPARRRPLRLRLAHADRSRRRPLAGHARRRARRQSLRHVSGQAERRYALYLEPKGVRARQTIFRILGVVAGPVRRRRRLRRFASIRRNAGPAGCVVSTQCPTPRRCVSITEPRPRSPATSRSTRSRPRSRAARGELRDRMGAPLDACGRPTTSSSTSTYPGELKVYLSKDKLPSLGRRAPRARSPGPVAVAGRRDEGRVRLHRPHARRAQERDHQQALRQGDARSSRTRSASPSRAASSSSTATRCRSARAPRRRGRK